MDKDFAQILMAVIVAIAIGMSLEAVNPHRKPESKVNPVTAAIVWAVVLGAIAVLG